MGGVDNFFKNRLKKVQNSLKMAFFDTFFEKFSKLKIENPKFINGGGVEINGGGLRFLGKTETGGGPFNTDVRVFVKTFLYRLITKK